MGRLTNPLSTEQICCGLCLEPDPDFGCTPHVSSLETHLLFIAANSCTPQAIVSSCSSVRGQGESMRGMRRTKFVEYLEL